MTKRKDLTGQKFGKLTVIEYAGTNKHGGALWLCQCECGNRKIVPSRSLVTGHSKSCGCIQETIKQNLGNLNRKHGLSKTKLHYIWSTMKSRCNCPTCKKYKIYGARGIKVCQEWLDDFINFYNWAINNGYSNGLTIDRIDVNGNYEPSNCRWADAKQQSRNRRTNRYIYYKGKKYCAVELAETIGMNVVTLKKRLNNGLSVEEAITKPIRKNHLITHNGETHNITEWENILGFKHGLIKERLRKNWTIKQVLETPVFGNKDNYK